MAISPANFKLIELLYEIFPQRLNNLSMLELGNIEIKIDSLGRPPAKKYFSGLGIQHTSFDVNEKDGAIPIDLNFPVDDELYHDKFEIVTNFGTSEHIKNQYQVFETIHDCCKMGGAMLHTIPLVGYWRGHCPYHYTKQFPKELCDNNNYELYYSEIVQRWNEYLINFIAIKKGNEKFVFSKKEITTTNNYKRNEDNLF